MASARSSTAVRSTRSSSPAASTSLPESPSNVPERGSRALERHEGRIVSGLQGGAAAAGRRARGGVREGEWCSLSTASVRRSSLNWAFSLAKPKMSLPFLPGRVHCSSSTRVEDVLALFTWVVEGVQGSSSTALFKQY